jgi:hypothetical protein
MKCCSESFLDNLDCLLDLQDMFLCCGVIEFDIKFLCYCISKWLVLIVRKDKMDSKSCLISNVEHVLQRTPENWDLLTGISSSVEDFLDMVTKNGRLLIFVVLMHSVTFL